MKLKLLSLQFTILFAFFLLPPVFVPPENTASLSFSPFVFVYLILGVLLNIQSYRLKKMFAPVYPQKPGKFTYITTGTICFGIMMILFALVQIVGLIFPETSNAANFENLNLNPFKFSAIVFQLAVISFEEEVLYREFCPLCLDAFAAGKDIKFRKVYKIIAEIFMLLIFAAGHRYLGLIAVLNAFLCGIVLRVCAFKTDSIYTGSIIHFIYNLINFLLLISGK